MQLLGSAPEAARLLQERVTGRLCVDSRQVRPGDAFIAWPGHATDGRRYVAAAPNGYVGVGTANPLSGRLHVVGGGTTAVYADGGSATGVQGHQHERRWCSRCQQQF